MAGVARESSRLPTLPTVAPSFVTGIVAEVQGYSLHQVHRSERALHRQCPRKIHLVQVLLGGRVLLSMFEGWLTPVRRLVLTAQPILHCENQSVFFFHNYHLLLRHLMAEQDGGPAG